MVTQYATAQKLAEFLKITDNTGVIITLGAGTDPTLAYVEDLIKRAEDEIDYRTQHAWRLKQIREMHDIINEYEYGQGVPIHLHHRNIQPISAGSGDKVESWDGSNWQDITNQETSTWQMNYDMGILNMIGFMFSIFRENRIRVTFRYGGEPLDGGAPVVPRDIEEATLKLAAIQALQTAFAGRNIQFGQDRGVRLENVISTWKEDVDKIIERHAEWVHVEF